MLDGRDRFRPVRLRRLDLARASATDPVERRQRELVPGPALQPLQKMRVRLPIDHHFLPLGELATIGQQESLDGGATIVALFPLQLDSVRCGAGCEQSRRSWRHCARLTRLILLIINRAERFVSIDFERGKKKLGGREFSKSPDRDLKFYFFVLFFHFSRNYLTTRSREFERNRMMFYATRKQRRSTVSRTNFQPWPNYAG